IEPRHRAHLRLDFVREKSLMSRESLQIVIAAGSHDEFKQMGKCLAPGACIGVEQVLQGLALMGTTVIKIFAVIQQVLEYRAQKRTGVLDQQISSQLNLPAFRRPPGEGRDFLSRNA